MSITSKNERTTKAGSVDRLITLFVNICNDRDERIREDEKVQAGGGAVGGCESYKPWDL